MGLTLHKGRPENTDGRLEKEIRVYDLLDELGLEYYRVDHAPAMTMEVCKEIDEALGALICKNLFLCNRQKTRFYLLMMPGHKVFKTKILSHIQGTARLSFAPAENMEALLGLRPGSVSVLGLINDTEKKVHLVIDRDVLADEYIGCHPCVSTSSLKIKTSDLLEKILPELGVTPRIIELTEED